MTRAAVSSPPVVQDSELLPQSGRVVVEEEFHPVSPMFHPTARVDQAVSPAILAPLPAVSELETKPNKPTEPQPDPRQGQPDHQMEHDHMVISGLHSSMTNFSQELLTPWSCQGSKIFLDICSGVDAPLSCAVSRLGLPALHIDLLVDTNGFTG